MDVIHLVQNRHGRPGSLTAPWPIVTVHYAQCLKVKFLAGGGYNLIGVDPTVFNGRQDQHRELFAGNVGEPDESRGVVNS